jgi:membrane-bound ClpP family serine protease
MEPWVWSVLLLLAGITIVGIEMFVPSGGVLAVMAGLCFVGSIVVAFMESLQTGVIMLGATTLAVPIVIAVAVQWWPHTPIGKRMLIQPPENPDELLPDNEEFRGLKALVGQRGRSTSKMLPGGTVKIDRRDYEAMTLGMPIDENVPVEVVEVRMNRLVVRPCEASDESQTAATTTKSDDLLSRPIDTLGLEDPLA